MIKKTCNFLLKEATFVNVSSGFKKKHILKTLKTHEFFFAQIRRIRQSCRGYTKTRYNILQVYGTNLCLPQFKKKLPQCCPWDSLKKNYKILCIFAYVTSRLYLYSLFFSSRESTSKVAEWVRRWPKSWKDPGSNPAWTLFLPFFAQAQFFLHFLRKFHACVDTCMCWQMHQMCKNVHNIL